MPAFRMNVGPVSHASFIGDANATRCEKSTSNIAQTWGLVNHSPACDSVGIKCPTAGIRQPRLRNTPDKQAFGCPRSLFGRTAGQSVSRNRILLMVFVLPTCSFCTDRVVLRTSRRSVMATIFVLAADSPSEFDTVRRKSERLSAPPSDSTPSSAPLPANTMWVT